MYLLSGNDVIHVHDQVLNPGEPQGLAADESLSGALSRVEFRLAYGLIKDEFELAATYAVVLSTGHLFNDGNKRTAFRCMDVVLRLHGRDVIWDTETVGQKIIEVAQGKVDEIDLAAWLRGLNWITIESVRV
ncbi:MAG: type II toxin-antitoxin system death-on-curing family toxin [Rhodobacter sp.]|nr:type II toxin-antitoxin system death-on-curing family toxin [Rhodobacter sp.]